MDKPERLSTAKILTANDLHSGGVVFATAHGDWSPFISQALLSDDAVTNERLETCGQHAVERQLVVEPFFIDVSIENGLPRAIRFREQLRVNGPSVQTAFSKPAFREVA